MHKSSTRDGDDGGTNTLQVKPRIRARDLVPDELLYSDVVLRHKVDRVFLLADASRARRTLDRVRAFEYERPRFTREVGRESEDVLKLCRSERAGHGLGGHGQNDGDRKLHKVNRIIRRDNACLRWSTCVNLLARPLERGYRRQSRTRFACACSFPSHCSTVPPPITHQLTSST